MERLLQDVRFAVRGLLRSPTLSVAAILTLALGIGANSAMFSLVNAILLRPLPFADPSRLVMVYERSHGLGRKNISGHEFIAWRTRTKAFESMSMYSFANLTMRGRGEPVSVTALTVSGEFFHVLGQPALIGRLPLNDDSRAPRPEVVLSRSLWHKQFGGDSSVIGR